MVAILLNVLEAAVLAGLGLVGRARVQFDVDLRVAGVYLGASLGGR